MIEVEWSNRFNRNRIEVSFPEIHPDARLFIDVFRTLKAADDGLMHQCPHFGLGMSPYMLANRESLSEKCSARSHFFYDLYQSETVRIRFKSPYGFPFAVRYGQNGSCGITGRLFPDQHGEASPLSVSPQNYFSVSDKPVVLDGTLDCTGHFHQFLGSDMARCDPTLSAEALLQFATRIDFCIYPLRAELWQSAARRDQLEYINLSHDDAAPAIETATPASPGYRIAKDSRRISSYESSSSEHCSVFLINHCQYKKLLPVFSPKWSEVFEKIYPARGTQPVEYFGPRGKIASFGTEEFGIDSQTPPLSKPPVEVADGSRLVVLRDSENHIALTRQILDGLNPDDIIFFRNSGRMGEESTYRFCHKNGSLYFTDYGWDGHYETEIDSDTVLKWLGDDRRNRMNTFYLGFGTAIFVRRDWMATPIGRALFRSVLYTNQKEVVRSFGEYSVLVAAYLKLIKDFPGSAYLDEDQHAKI